MLKQSRTLVEKQLFQSLGLLLEHAPWSTCRLVGGWMGLAFHVGVRSRRETAIRNLKLVFPHLSQRERQRLARRSAQNFAMSFCEFMHLGAASEGEIRDYCLFEGLTEIRAAMEDGRGVLLPTAHFGAWEVMGARAALEFPLTVVVRLSHNEALRAHIEKTRARIQVAMLHKSAPARSSLEILHRGQGLAIFADQHSGRHGLRMNMFGAPTKIINSPARLALVTGAPLVPTFATRRAPWFADGRVVVKSAPALRLKLEGQSREEAVERGTRFVTETTEDFIRQYPDLWLWMHRRWREKDGVEFV